MTKFKALIGALAIMTAAGMIVDFELADTESDMVVRIWSPDDQDESHLRKQVAALLSRYVNEEQVIVVDSTVPSRSA